MQEQECPVCKEGFTGGVQGAPVDGQRESFCCEECRDQAERWENQRRAYPGHWMPPAPFPWGDLSDPFAE